MLIKSRFEELFCDEQVVMLDRSKSRDKIASTLCAIYTSLGVVSPAQEILVKVAQSTFTKLGTYTIFIIASKKKGKVYLMVDANEIRGGSDIYYELPNLAYKPKFFGLLGYRVALAKSK